jgi:hypothetical protein
MAQSYYWLVEWYSRNSRLILRREFPISKFGERKIQELLRSLVCSTLTPQQIADAYDKKNDLLAVRKEAAYPKFRCGLNPEFVASVRVRDRSGR